MLELAIVMAIVGILATLLLPNLAAFRDRAEKAVCIGNLRSLHVSLAAHLADHKRWPQVPEGLDKKQYDEFWIETLEPYGTSERGWLCSSILRRQRAGELESSDDDTRLHYLPAEFDAHQFTPNKWPGMPWAMEIGSFHGGGNLLIRADGGIKELNQLLEEAGQGGILDLNK